jgi:hypothetical protein
MMVLKSVQEFRQRSAEYLWSPELRRNTNSLLAVLKSVKAHRQIVIDEGATKQATATIPTDGVAQP